MSVRCRPMKARDVSQSVGILASHAIVAPRYGEAINQLGPAWLRVLDCDAFRTIVFEEVEGDAVRLVGAGTSVFVTDQFLLEIKTAPFFWIGSELASQIMQGKSPLLRNDEVRAANSNGGLNLVLWHLCIHPEDTRRAEVRTQVSAGFFEAHRGFLLKELIALQASFAEEPGWIVDGGALMLNPADGRYADPTEKADAAILWTPHVFGLSRELALSKMSWISSLFHHEPPRIVFSGSEQRLLLAALRGGTDEELSDELTISLSAVKKAWISIYDRAAMRLPKSILGNGNGCERGEGERGKQKKQRLLGYLREHPEELRPYSRRSLNQNSENQVVR